MHVRNQGQAIRQCIEGGFDYSGKTSPFQFNFHDKKTTATRMKLPCYLVGRARAEGQCIDSVKGR